MNLLAEQDAMRKRWESKNPRPIRVSLSSPRLRSESGQQVKPFETGQVIANFTVIGRDTSLRTGSNAHKAWWKVKCTCGEETSIIGSVLRRKMVSTVDPISMGCRKCRRTALVNLLGKTFNLLTVRKYIGDSLWECACSCGSPVPVIASYHQLTTRTHNACEKCLEKILEDEQAAGKVLRKKARVQEVLAKTSIQSGICPVDGKQFTYAFIAGSTPQKYCKPECANKANWVTQRHVKRARKAKAAVIEYIDAFGIFNRDHWICQICGDPAPKELQGLNRPDSPEIDHLAALENGGTNTEDNLRLVHRKCQLWKQKHVDDPLLSVREYFHEIYRGAPPLDIVALKRFLSVPKGLDGKITPDQKEAIQGLHSMGAGNNAIQELLGIGVSTVRKVLEESGNL